MRGQNGSHSDTRGHVLRTLFSVSKKGLKNEPPGSVLGSRNRAKIGKKSIRHRYRHPPPFFHKFWSAVGFKVEVPNPTCPSETICFCGWQRKPAFVTRGRFCIDFGTPSAPFWHHFGAQIDKISLRNDLPNHLDFYCVSSLIF